MWTSSSCEPGNSERSPESHTWLYTYGIYTYNWITYNTYSSLPAQAPALLSVSSAVWISLLFFFFFSCTCLNPTNKDYLKFLIFQEKSSWNSQNPIGTEVFRVLKGITGPLLCGLIMLNVCPWAHRFLEPGGHWTHPLCLSQRGVCSGVSGLNSSINLTENLASVVGTFRRL